MTHDFLSATTGKSYIVLLKNISKQKDKGYSKYGNKNSLYKYFHKVNSGYIILYLRIVVTIKIVCCPDKVCSAKTLAQTFCNNLAVG